MQTPAKISAEIAKMRQQLQSLNKAIKERECALLEAQLYEASGLRVGDDCQYPDREFCNIPYKVCVAKVASPFVFIECPIHRIYLAVADFSKLQKVTT